MAQGKQVSISLILLDAFVVVLVFNLTGYARGVINPEAPLLMALELPVLAHLLSVYLIDGYNPRTDMMSITYTSLHIISLLAALLVTLLLTYAFIPAGFTLQTSRFVTLVSCLSVIPIT